MRALSYRSPQWYTVSTQARETPPSLCRDFRDTHGAGAKTKSAAGSISLRARKGGTGRGRGGAAGPRGAGRPGPPAHSAAQRGKYHMSQSYTGRRQRAACGGAEGPGARQAAAARQRGIGGLPPHTRPPPLWLRPGAAAPQAITSRLGGHAATAAGHQAPPLAQWLLPLAASTGCRRRLPTPAASGSCSVVLDLEEAVLAPGEGLVADCTSK